uniref:Uncharacterized protein n=1 Tax=Physcomitrium patens TaxID=3218 RepID=A0A2K1JZN0_PHYPA|nr:hypothetical protein PHYPA_014098 [Physcomitrium patens]
MFGFTRGLLVLAFLVWVSPRLIWDLTLPPSPTTPFSFSISLSLFSFFVFSVSLWKIVRGWQVSTVKDYVNKSTKRYFINKLGSQHMELCAL